MKKIYLHFTLSLFIIAFVNIHAQTITTVAGTGVAGYNGDNIAATVAQLYQPASVTVDRNGNILVADFLNSRIRKISTTGFITTFSGTGNSEYNGDNIPSSSASLNRPENAILDAMGNIYIEDTYNHRIRKVTTNGTITTIAGTGNYGYSGDNILAINTNLSYPSDGILIDRAGNIYISDTYVNRIRKIDVNGIITTIAGTGVAGYNGDNIPATSAQINTPYALAIDSIGNLFFADGFNHRVRKISTSGVITTVAGTGVAGYNGDNIAAATASLNRPIGLLIDGAGTLFITDGLNNRIRKVSINGLITSIAGTGNAGYNGDNIPATLADLNYPNGLAIDATGSLLIADLGNHRIRKITNAAVILPLTLTHFTASLTNSLGLLQWQTTNEVNTQMFIIERSQDASSFTILDSVKAKNTMGSNKYSFTDATIKSGVTYYRLKMVDKDGKFTYSNIVSVKLNESTVIGLSPNPVENMTAVSFTATVAGKYTMQIVDMAGRNIHQATMNAIVGSNKVTFDTHSYSKGEYILTLTNAEGKKASVKFTK